VDGALNSFGAPSAFVRSRGSRARARLHVF
jgi:hypothetical protein